MTTLKVMGFGTPVPWSDERVALILIGMKMEMDGTGLSWVWCEEYATTTRDKIDLIHSARANPELRLLVAWPGKYKQDIFSTTVDVQTRALRELKRGQK